ncbi:MAG: PqiA/YebS family transporter subunit [Deltaproteobacteria bacterium]|nr:PqiA/YebS family transporter subunit [Deltaproteobacteria bacterium]
MKAQTINLDKYTACEGCDLLLPIVESPPGHSTVCPRCSTTISRRSTHSIVKTLALSATGLLLYLPSTWLPLMSIESFGFSESANIIDSMINFYTSGYYFVSLMVLISALILPLVLLSLIFTVSLHLRLKRYPLYLTRLFRIYIKLEEWAMVEVYLLGIMITIIKMMGHSEIHYHMGMLCFILLVITSLAITTVVDKDFFWRTMERGEAGEKGRRPDFEIMEGDDSVTAAEKRIQLCHICHKLSPFSDAVCPRCGDTLHRRKPMSVSRTWALVVSSALFFIPANLMPIMQVDFLGMPDRSTILDGIIYFLHTGSYGIGLIIFIASILVPVFKIVGLTILLLSTHPRSVRFLKQKTAMFRFISFIGRWSMLDIFVIALLTVLVDFGFFSSIHTAPAATYFCFVVAFTMLAAISFDPRIMWDKYTPLSKDKDHD